jgi:hypothetical protein
MVTAALPCSPEGMRATGLPEPLMPESRACNELMT